MQQRLALLLFVVFLNLFLFHAFGSLGTLLLISGFGIFLVTTFFDAEFFSKARQPLLILLLFTLAQGYSLVSRAQGFIEFVMFASLLLLSAIFVYINGAKSAFFASLFECITMPVILGINYVFATWRSISVLGTSSPSKSSSKIRSYVRPLVVGLIFGLPIAYILVVLFSGADPIYAHLVKQIFTLKISERLIVRAVVSFVAAVFLWPLAKLTIKQRPPDFNNFLYTRGNSFAAEMTVVMSLVAVVLASFLVVQSKYVFVNVAQETDLAQFGVATYSQYVQRGFFELLLISVLLYGLTWVGLLILKGKKQSEKAYLQWVQIVVLGEFGIFIASVVRRIWLYQAFHGWSLIRIYGGIFLLWVALMAFTLLLRHFYKRRWVVYEVLGTGLILVFVGFFNAEAFIVMTHPPTVNNRVDYTYLSRMSADGYVGWQKAFTFAQNTLQNASEKSFFGRDERREIVYAGTVVQKLLTHYEDLNERYATQKESAAYKTTVLARMTTNHRQLVQLLEASIAAQPRRSDQGTPTPLEMELETGVKRQQQFDTLLQKLMMAGQMDMAYLAIDRHYYPFFNESPCLVTDYLHDYLPRDQKWGASFCESTFYDIVSLDKSAPSLGTLDRLFTYNRAEAEAFRRMSHDIPYQTLLDLEQTYFSLTRKILGQPANERGVDIDVSFDTPLL